MIIKVSPVFTTATYAAVMAYLLSNEGHIDAFVKSIKSERNQAEARDTVFQFVTSIFNQIYVDK